jgi:hypothetical protein
MSTPKKITAMDLLIVLSDAEALETFCRLPKTDQEKFSRWIGKSRDVDSHWRRINALVEALTSGPLHLTNLEESINSPGATG